MSFTNMSIVKQLPKMPPGMEALRDASIKELGIEKEKFPQAHALLMSMTNALYQEGVVAGIRYLADIMNHYMGHIDPRLGVMLTELLEEIDKRENELEDNAIQAVKKSDKKNN